LKGAKQEAEEYLKTETAIIDKRAIVYQIQRNQLETKVESARKKKEELETQLKEQRYLSNITFSFHSLTLERNVISSLCLFVCLFVCFLIFSFTF
jgi:ABC-type lipoprotein release transport system permease subunit